LGETSSYLDGTVQETSFQGEMPDVGRYTYTLRENLGMNPFLTYSLHDTPRGEVSLRVTKDDCVISLPSLSSMVGVLDAVSRCNPFLDSNFS